MLADDLCQELVARLYERGHQLLQFEHAVEHFFRLEDEGLSAKVVELVEGPSSLPSLLGNFVSRFRLLFFYLC